MKKSNQEAAEKITFKNLQRLYFFALLTIALTIIVSQFLVQYNLNQQLSDSRAVAHSSAPNAQGNAVLPNPGTHNSYLLTDQRALYLNKGIATSA